MSPLSTCPAPDVTLTGGFGINNADIFYGNGIIHYLSKLNECAVLPYIIY